MSFAIKDCDCNGEEFIRGSKNIICEICNEEFWRHPYCKNFTFINSLDRKEYYIHVLCDGTHVKL